MEEVCDVGERNEAGNLMRLLLANFSKMVGDTGGVAKVHCSFANEMKRRGHDVAMVFFDDKVGKPFFPVDDCV